MMKNLNIYFARLTKISKTLNFLVGLFTLAFLLSGCGDACIFDCNKGIFVFDWS